MLKRVAIFLLVLAALAGGSPAEACWGRWGGFGWGGYGWGGYGGYGWGGYPYYSMYRGFGYPGFGYGFGFYPGFSSNYMGYGGLIGGFATNGPVVVGSAGLGLASNRPTTVTVTSIPVGPAVAAAAPASTVTTRALAVQQLLGLKELHLLEVAPRTAATRAAIASHPAKASALRPVLVDDIVARHSNSEGRRKAERLIAEGDELFRAQNFHPALQKYKQAASAAPDLAEAQWRMGHALVATHNYDLAARSFKRAIALTDDLGRGGFRLADLYGAATRTKAVHLDSLAEWAMSRGSVSSDPYFLIGLFLHYDGQAARAEKFFAKASDIAGISGGHIAVFLAPAVDAAPVMSAAPHTSPASGPAVSTSIVPISFSREI